jgi:hypothetical protein
MEAVDIEEWRPVQERPDLYEVSSLGRVRNRETGRFLSLSDHSGYLACGLSIDGKTPSFPVHRLVAKSFIPNQEKKDQINHKDKNKHNNSVSNLEWCTNEENSIHRSAGVAQTSNQNLKTKMVDLDTLLVLKTFDSITEAAEYVVSQGLSASVPSARSSIGNCARGVTQKSFGCKWEIEKGTGLEGEEWRNVVLNGSQVENYFVSNLGRFKNSKGVIMDDYKSHASGDINVCINRAKYPLHRLVAFAFVSNPENKNNVVHIDGNKANNCANNLRWMSSGEMTLENRKTGLNPGFQRETIVFDRDMNEIKRYKSAKEASADLNVSYSCVKDVLSGKQKSTKGFILKYSDQ